MRTAEEILKEYDNGEVVHWLAAIDGMKEYAKEAIEECANRAFKYNKGDLDGKHLKEWILEFIKELK